MRITTQLIRAIDGFHLWSKTYNRELKDIFAIQEDISITVANEFKATLGIGNAIKRLGGTEKVEAYEHYLRAQGLWNRNLVKESDIINKLELARESIEESLRIDPDFALAWAYKSIIHMFISMWGALKFVDANMDLALSAAKKAIELEPKSSAGYISLAIMQNAQGDFIKAKLERRLLWCAIFH